MLRIQDRWFSLGLWRHHYSGNRTAGAGMGRQKLSGPLDELNTSVTLRGPFRIAAAPPNRPTSYLQPISWSTGLTNPRYAIHLSSLHSPAKRLHEIFSPSLPYLNLVSRPTGPTKLPFSGPSLLTSSSLHPTTCPRRSQSKVWHRHEIPERLSRLFLSYQEGITVTKFRIYSSRLEMIQRQMKGWRPEMLSQLATWPYSDPLRFYWFWFASFVGIIE